MAELPARSSQSTTLTSVPPPPSSTCTGVEKKAAAKLQDGRTFRKIIKIDDDVCLTFAGLYADSRVLISRAQTEAQSYRLTLDEKVSVDHMAKFIAGIQQKYTQSGQWSLSRLTSLLPMNLSIHPITIMIFLNLCFL